MASQNSHKYYAILCTIPFGDMLCFSKTSVGKSLIITANPMGICNVFGIVSVQGKLKKLYNSKCVDNRENINYNVKKLYLHFAAVLRNIFNGQLCLSASIVVLVMFLGRLWLEFLKRFLFPDTITIMVGFTYFKGQM